jgi:trafficking protein particle complex subunit 8
MQVDSAADHPGDPLNLVLKAFVPHVAVFSSSDTEELVRAKGFPDGLWQLLRPFGERVLGKVTIRDSNGASRSWDDYSIRFVRLGENVESPDVLSTSTRLSQSLSQSHFANGTMARSERSKAKLSQVDAVVDRHLRYAEESLQGLPAMHALPARQDLDGQPASPYYSLYLRRLLASFPMAPHETFSHPVACVIAISSRNTSPIEELRNLYTETREGERRLPEWVDGDYLRYYILVHDEERDDMARSMQLFDQMKRHLGLHCHLLRLRSTQGAETDDDSIPLPRSDWLTAAEELTEIERAERDDDVGHAAHYIFESDATAIHTFVREMVTQSIIPTMERHVAIWNENVASRRRGITGRLVTFGRKWAGFSSGSRSSSSPSTGGSPSSGYDPQGFYRPESPEATMRKLADFAVMLRDWKLARSTFDLVRSDFSESKAWKHHAAANEMAAISLLMLARSAPSKARAETIDQMLEASFYSYHTRCSDVCGALRCLVLGMELLRLRRGSSVDEAARWGLRLLDSKIAGPVGDALLRERIAVCYASKQRVGSQKWGRRRRKSALWSIMSAEAWMGQSRYIQAQKCVNEAMRIYSGSMHEAEAESDHGGIEHFTLANSYLVRLQQQLAEKMESAPAALVGGRMAAPHDEPPVDEESEALDVPVRRRRASTLGGSGGGASNLETAPLRDDSGDFKPQDAMNAAGPAGPLIASGP